MERPHFASAQTFSSQFALSLSLSSETLALPILYSDNSASGIQPFDLQIDGLPCFPLALCSSVSLENSSYSVFHQGGCA